MLDLLQSWLLLAALACMMPPPLASFTTYLNHCGDEKAYRTLGVTKGYKQTKLKPYYCKTCAASKARNFGLSRKHPPPAPVMPAYEDAQYNDTIR